MTTEQEMREAFEKEHPKPDGESYCPLDNKYRVDGLITSRYHKTNYQCLWQGYQSGCAASAERIQELERQLAEIDEPKEVTSKGCNFCTHPLYAGVVCHICGTVK